MKKKEPNFTWNATIEELAKLQKLAKLRKPVVSNNETVPENLNISDIMESLSVKEQEMIQKGKNHWSLDILNKIRGGYIDSKTIKELIDKVIENTWTQAKVFYENRSEDNAC